MLLGVFLLLPAFARADDAPHYSVKDAPIPTKAFPEQARSMYIGAYGESFTYEMEWVLHPPVLKNGIEVVRFHSMLTNPPDKAQVKDSDYKEENFTPLNLVELVVMPKTSDQFRDLGALRAAKAEALTRKGAVFQIEPMGDGKWPESTFAVFISSPYPLYQRYAETKGQIYILTTGLKGVGNGSLGYPTGGGFVGALGDYFYRLQPRIDPRTTERPQLGFLKFIVAPLLLLGIALLAVPWGKKYLRPLARSSGTASILGSAVYIGSFYAARWIDVIGHGGLVSMGVVGWAMIPLFLIAIFLRTRKLAEVHKWVVWGASLAATAFLIVVGCAMQDEIARNQATVATAFSTYMFNVSLLYGACWGLASRGGSDSKIKAIPVLIAVLSMFASIPVAAQVTASADRQAAIRKIDLIKSHAILERIRATQQLRETRDFNEIQSVALDGIFATDENPRQIERYFNLHLQPSHNNEGKYSPRQSNKSSSWWQ